MPYKSDIFTLEDFSQNVSFLENKLNSQDDELKELEKNLNLSKEITEKTKEYLLLEMEALLDKQNLTLNNQNNKINTFDEKLDFFKSTLISKDEDISSLNDQINSLNELMFLKEKEIDNLRGIVSSKDEDISSLNDQINSLNELMLSREKKIKSIRDKLTLKASELRAAENEIKITQNKFNILESKYDDNQKILEGAKKELLAYDAKFENQKIIENSYKELIEINKKELENTKKYFSGRISHLEDQLKSEFLIQSRKIDFYEYCLNFYEEKTYNNEVEINYLKNSNKLSKKILEPFAYLLIFSKSNPRELGRNIRLYKALKNSNFFDIGYYLNKYSDIPESKWCKYFSPELHYVCKGFNENRKINKKDFHSKNKNELLKYIKNN